MNTPCKIILKFQMEKEISHNFTSETSLLEALSLVIRLPFDPPLLSIEIKPDKEQKEIIPDWLQS